MTDRRDKFLLRTVGMVYGPYVAYAVVMGEESFKEAETFHNWVIMQQRERDLSNYDVSDLYDLWLGVPDKDLNRGGEHGL